MSSYEARFLDELVVEGLVTRTFVRLDPGRRMALMNALWDVAAERGVARVGIKEVAHRSGVPVGSLYQYFSDRDTMVRFACRWAGGRLAEELRSWIPELSAMPLRQGMEAWLVGGLEWAEAGGSLMKVFAVAAYQAAVADGQDQAGIQPDPVAKDLVEPVAVAMQEMIRALLVACRDRGELHPELPLETAVRLTTFLLTGLGDSQLLPGLNRYFRLFDSPQSADETLRQSLDLWAQALTGQYPPPSTSP